MAISSQVAVSGGVSTEVVTYPRTLLETARLLIDMGKPTVAIIVAHVACEVAAQRVLAKAFETRELGDLEDAVNGFLSGYNLANERIRKLYTALTGDHVEQQEFWAEFRDSASRRNKAAHDAARFTPEEAERSYQAAKAFLDHLQQ